MPLWAGCFENALCMNGHLCAPASASSGGTSSNGKACRYGSRPTHGQADRKNPRAAGNRRAGVWRVCANSAQGRCCARILRGVRLRGNRTLLGFGCWFWKEYWKSGPATGVLSDRPPVSYQTGHGCPQLKRKRAPWEYDLAHSTRPEEEEKRGHESFLREQEERRPNGGCDDGGTI